jgi:hypothetical protein
MSFLLLTNFRNGYKEFALVLVVHYGKGYKLLSYIGLDNFLMVICMLRSGFRVKGYHSQVELCLLLCLIC